MIPMPSSLQTVKGVTLSQSQEYITWQCPPGDSSPHLAHSGLPARLLVDDTHAFILTDCEVGNPDALLVTVALT